MDTEILLREGLLQIPCKVSEPEDGDIRRVVLGVHGFGGCMEDQIQRFIAEEMDMLHCATVRFDFPAHGISPLESEDFTLQNCLDILYAVARYAKERFAQVEDLCIFATGFGAYITLLSLQDLLELPGRLRLVVQTPSVLMHETLLSMVRVSRETLWAMDTARINAPNRPFTVDYRFYEDLRENIALTTYPIPMLILMGEDDSYIRMSDIQQFRRINEQSKLVIIPGAGHQFMEEGAWDMVLDLTRDWFEFQQVYLTDWL